MITDERVLRSSLRAATLLAAAIGITGCSLVVSFDRSRITDGGDAGEMDGGRNDAGPPDAGMDDAGPRCGNSMLDTGEGCDDGNAMADDGCSATCDVEAGWSCMTAGSACTEICGDGMVVGDEVCDDGFTDACGSCNADCTATGAGSTCADSMICEETEECDDGDTDVDDGCDDMCEVELGWVCNNEPSECAETCGDGTLDTGEMCDDGNPDDDDGCTNCQIDRGYMCPTADMPCVTTCGDGIIAGAEECDDSGTAADDGCSATCTFETGWACINEPSVCSEVCGDNMMVGGEACDDGNTMTEAACPYGMATCMVCNADCSASVARTGNVCGDTSIDAVNETCDDGDMTSMDGCSATCQTEMGWTCMGMPSACTPTCGDGLLRGTEMCDDGGTTSGNGCSATCTIESGWMCSGTPSSCMPICGDGLIRGSEMCDDNGTTSGNGCSSTCTIETGWTCMGAPSTCTPTCGDGMVVGSEACDDRNTSACGLCNATCTAVVAPVAASGSITTIGEGTGALVDGNTFVLNDGVNPATTFEFDSNSSLMVAGRVPVTIMSGGDANSVRDAILVAVNMTAPTLDITATSGGTAMVLLNNDAAGGFGNNAISETVPGAGFIVSGMSGGLTRDCPATTGCNAAGVCRSGTCTSNMCM
ncbi:MAG: DUF4215 domain-containing protein [Sandaracinaceae bacterium]